MNYYILATEFYDDPQRFYDLCKTKEDAMNEVRIDLKEREYGEVEIEDAMKALYEQDLFDDGGYRAEITEVQAPK